MTGTAQKVDKQNLAAEMAAMGRTARDAARALARATTHSKNTALNASAKALIARTDAILAANATDMAAAKQHALGSAMTDRLWLDPGRIRAIADGLIAIAALPDPVGQTIADWTRPNGLRIRRVRTPLGAIGIIYESRPNVTADAGALCLKSGNACILRGGSESIHSSVAIHQALQHGLREAGLPEGAIQLVQHTDRAAVGMLLTMTDSLDVIVPRGGKSLIERVQRESRIPVLAHLEGNCHVYVHKAADLEMARKIVINAKMRRTGVCGAAETLLIDRAIAPTFLPILIDDLIKVDCEVRADAETALLDKRVHAATEADWATEYLDAIIAVRQVENLEAAIEHIAQYGSHHTEAIITSDRDAAARFFSDVDSAILLHNASTQFADGGEFGMGAEIGIATGKLHARGPVGVEQLTSYKYVVEGDGQIRP